MIAAFESPHPDRRIFGFHRLLGKLLLISGVLVAAIHTRGADGVRIQKVIHQYALTSANDFPQRDPQDWRLLGSNDGGKPWTALDVRKGEIFQERHQRRLFKIANQTAFETYRLQID